MASKPISALATLLDDINSSNNEIDTPVNAEVVMPNIDEINDAIVDKKPQMIPAPSSKIETNSNNSPHLLYVDPHECHLWRFADRPDDEVGDIESLATSMKQHGQQEPVLIRLNTQKTKHHYEIIFGSRRWKAAKFLDLTLIAIIKQVTDQEAARFQKEENENRQDLSDYARAKSYKKQIDSGIFKSESDFSKSLNISKRTMNDLMAYIRVPQKIIDTIPNYKDISRVTAVKLAVLSKNKDLHERLIELGVKIGNKTITASNIESELNKQYLRKPLNEFSNIINAQGKVIAKLKRQLNGAVTININSKVSQQLNIDDLCKKLSKLLSNTT